MFNCNFDDEDSYKTANTRKGLYVQCNGYVVNYLLSPNVLSMTNKKEGRSGLIDPLNYYL